MTTEGNTSGAVGPHAKISRDDLRKQIVLTIAEDAKASGKLGFALWQYLHETYPDVPSDVVEEAEMLVLEEKDEAWWASVERTIDAEIINGAIRAKEENGQ